MGERATRPIAAKQLAGARKERDPFRPRRAPVWPPSAVLPNGGVQLRWKGRAADWKASFLWRSLAIGAVFWVGKESLVRCQLYNVISMPERESERERDVRRTRKVSQVPSGGWGEHACKI